MDVAGRWGEDEEASGGVQERRGVVIIGYVYAEL